MKARRLFLLGLLLAVAAGGGIWKLAHPSEPIHNGKKLSQWIQDLTPTFPEDSSLAQTNAVEAIRQIGDKGIPTLLRMVESGDSRFKLKLQGLLNKLPFKVSLPSTPDQRWQATEIFRLLGPSAKSAIPKLGRLVDKGDEKTADAAIRCLGVLGPDSLPILIKALRNPNSNVSGQAVNAIGEFGPAAKSAIPALLLKINVTNYDSQAIRVLGEIGDRSLISLFSQWLLNTNTAFDAAFALGRVGELSPLNSALTNANKTIRIAAIAALDPAIRETGPGRPRTEPDYTFARLNCVYNLKILHANLRIKFGTNGIPLTDIPAPLSAP